MKNPDINQNKSPSLLITERFAELGDWRGETLAHVRKLIKEADPEITGNGREELTPLRTLRFDPR